MSEQAMRLTTIEEAIAYDLTLQEKQRNEASNNNIAAACETVLFRSEVAAYIAHLQEPFAAAGVTLDA